MGMSLRGKLDKVLGSILNESPDPFASEVALVANGVVSLLAFFAAWLVLSLAALPSAIVASLLLVLLRAAFAHRTTTIAAGAVSALGIAVATGTAGWIMGQCAEMPAVPEICAAVCAVLGGALPASAYARLLKLTTPRTPRESQHSLVPSTR
jgi:hypothetical protein